MNNDRINDIRARWEAATPGPWVREDTPDYAEIHAAPDAVDRLQASRCSSDACDGCQFDQFEDCALDGLTREEANAAIAAAEKGDSRENR